MDADIVMRADGWYWFDLDGRLIGPYETRSEALRVSKIDEDVWPMWPMEYDLDT